MHYKYLILSLASSAAASLIPRQTDVAALKDCASKALDLLSGMPTPGPELEKALEGQPTAECTASVPSSLSSDYQKFLTSVASWANKGMSDLSTCPGYEENFTDVPTRCFSQMGITLASNTGAAASPTGGSSSTDSSSASVVSTTAAAKSSSSTAGTGSATSATKSGFAPRETGLGFAAVAMAGVALAAL